MISSPDEDPRRISGRASAAVALSSLAIVLVPQLVSLLASLTDKRPLAIFGPNITLRDLYPAEKGTTSRKRALWTTVVLAGGSLVQLALLVVARLAEGETLPWTAWVTALGWVIAGGHASTRRRLSVSYSTVAFLVVQLVSSVAALLLALDSDTGTDAGGRSRSMPITLGLASVALDLLLLGTCMTMPVVELPTGYLDAQEDLHARGKTGYSPEDVSSVAGWLTFGWLNPLISAGAKGYLDDEDVPELSPMSKARALFPLFSASAGSSLIRRVAKANSFDFLVDLVLSYVTVVLEYVPALVLKEVLAALRKPSPATIKRAYLFAGLGLIAHTTRLEIELNKRWFGRRASVRANTEICSQIYRKILVRTNTGTPAGVGKIIQMATSDSPDLATTDVSRIYNVPLQLAIGVTFLYSVLSWSAFAGIASIILLTPIQARLTKMGYTLQRASRKASDERTSVLSECLHSIKTIKLGGWDKLWLDKADAAREKELKLSMKASVVGLFFGLSGSISPVVVTVVSFFFYVQVQGRELTVERAFVSLSLLSMLQGPLSNLPSFVVIVTDTLVSARRIDDFLNEQEITRPSPSAPATSTQQRSLDFSTVGFIDGARSRWNVSPSSVVADGASSSPDPAAVFELGPLSFIFPTGALTVISGPIGAGKSALLLALLGEMETVNGSVLLPRDPTRGADEDGLNPSVAYASQTPWLQDLSIRDNILFGSKMDQKRYDSVVRVCCLLPDFAILEDGDETEIGSKGVSLSGGQKARVALARAVYSRAKTILLDDPLAAVDAGVAHSLVNDCLASALLKNRTVIIVSHHLELLLPIAHSVVHLVNGSVTAQGTVAELRESGHLGAIVEEEKRAIRTEAEPEKEGAEVEVKVAKVARKMTEKEGRGVGQVTLKTYKTYMYAATWTCVVAIGSLLILTDNAAIAERAWIAIWTRPDPPSSSRLPDSSEHPLFYLSVYMAISVAFVLLGLVRNLIGLVAQRRASRELHRRLLYSVMGATSRWLDITPQGRVLNRFTSDMAKINGPVLRLLTMTARSLASIGGSLVLIFAVLPPFLLPASIIALVYLKFSISYLRCTRDLQRIRAVTLSPILAGLESTLTGITTIRAFGAEERFLGEFFDQIDRNTAAEWFVWMIARWVMLRFDVLSALSVSITTVMVIRSRVDPGLGGMLILASQGLLSSIYWLNRYVASLEMAMNSVERVSEYLEIPQETPYDATKSPPAFWPSSSSETMISVQDLVVSYDPSLPPVLHGISFDVKPREKIGIVGRTGSGKSTLGASFSRFTEFTSGKIMIDNLDISTLPLRDLRARITHVSQEGSLWEGTVRENLDPYQAHSNDELDSVLRRVQLGSPIELSTASSTRAGSPVPGAIEATSRKVVVSLDTVVSSLSQGQRQLVSLGRALVRNSAIIIMDEATASVDLETDLLIQQTIREFTDSTLLTIAHRLSTIMDYDRVLVLENGRIVEFDTPYNLLNSEGEGEGVFKEMVKRTGRFEEMMEVARRKEEERRS